MVSSGDFSISFDNQMVSIVIPVHNVKSYLIQCLESVVNQTFHNLDIIIIDDGSTDGSSNICNLFAEKDDRIRVFHIEHKGIAYARNLGVKTAKGTYLLFVDSDDWIEQHTVAELLKAIIRNKADMVVSRFCCEYIVESVHPQKKHEQVQVFKGKDIFNAYAEGAIGNILWNKLFCSCYFPFLHFPEGHNYEDVFTIWKLLKYLAENNKTIVVLPEILFHFRVRKSSITHTKNMNNIIDQWKAYHGVFEELPIYREKLMLGCLESIWWMWFSYGGFSKKEKEEANNVVQEMQSFFMLFNNTILKGNYPRRYKVLCLLSHFYGPLVLWACFCGNRVYRLLDNNSRKMFD